MSSPSHTTDGFSIAPNQIFVTDFGADVREGAFSHLILGRHVYDHHWNELTVQELERDVDPNDVMNPVLLRGCLWKTVATSYWQVDDGNQLGPMPSQPGLDALCSDVYYADRRQRQSKGAQRRTPNTTGSTRTGLQARYFQDKQDYPQITTAHISRRRAGSFSHGMSQTVCNIGRALRKTRSSGDIAMTEDSSESDIEPGEDDEDIGGVDVVDCLSDVVAENVDRFRQQQGRKASFGGDSGIDVSGLD